MLKKDSFSARAGEIVSLDCVYRWQGLVPTEIYHNIDDNNEPDELGERVLFAKSVKVTATIEVF